jgi:hypothetical protein
VFRRFGTRLGEWVVIVIRLEVVEIGQAAAVSARLETPFPPLVVGETIPLEIVGRFAG